MARKSHEPPEDMPNAIALVRIDNEEKYVTDVTEGGYLPMIEIDDGAEEYYVAPTVEAAKEASWEYWDEMANHDAEELATIVGIDNIVQMWSVGKTLKDWHDEYMRYDGPEFDRAGYDHTERNLEVIEVYDEEEWEETGIHPGADDAVAYRNN